MSEFDRRERWQPAPRPEWVARLNEEGEILNSRSIVPLDENSLLAEARRNTSLDDFSDDGWIDHFRVLIHPISAELECWTVNWDGDDLHQLIIIIIN